MQIKEETSKIVKKVEKILLLKAYNRLKLVAGSIQADMREFNLKLWKASDTYNSLLYGDLTHELGFPQGEAPRMVDAILDKVADSIIVIPRLPKSGKEKTIIMSFKIVTKSLPGITDLPEAEVDTGKTVSNDISNDFGSFGAAPLSRKLPWVDWLLFRGNNYLIFNYEYVDVVDPDSRSGKGLMIRNENENWKVPSEYSGTRNSNWITRTLEDNIDFVKAEYLKIINNHMAKI